MRDAIADAVSEARTPPVPALQLPPPPMRATASGTAPRVPATSPDVGVVRAMQMRAPPSSGACVCWCVVTCLFAKRWAGLHYHQRRLLQSRHYATHSE
jgi:hypothetical protein